MSYLFHVADIFQNGQLSTTMTSTQSSLEPKAFNRALYKKVKDWYRHTISGLFKFHWSNKNYFY